jgi:UDP-glucose 4-epimerase
MHRNILITGSNSYIGDAVAEKLKAAGHNVTVLDLKNNMWQATDFSVFDVIFHVAGIAHDTTKSIKNNDIYFKVNYELALNVSKKAMLEGVRQFIFMSSLLVYNGSHVCKITKDTPTVTKGAYGESKLKADIELQKFNSSDFHVVILRSPMVFGAGCRGNFPRLCTLIKKLPIFPKIINERSMIHIDNLTEFVKYIIDTNANGVFFPQNPDYFCTSKVAEIIKMLQGKTSYQSKIMAWGVYLFFPFLQSLKKLFGDLIIEKSLSQNEQHFEGKYQIVGNEESIRKSIFSIIL